MRPSPSHIDAAAVGQRELRGLDGWLRRRLLDRLAALEHGRLVIDDAFGGATLGRAERAFADVRLKIFDPATYWKLALRGSVGAGEAYADGLWGCDDLVGCVRLLVRNRSLLDSFEKGGARLGGWLLRAWHALNRNSHEGSRRNIAAHYDLGNEFFGLFLSPDLMYSSALWQGEDDTLEAASARKLARICMRLRLQPTDRVIEIGSGWGGFALYAARHHGCHVTTTTISREQFRLARERVAQAGLADRITVLLEDYRNLRGAYDKLVSIEMVEAVGAEYLPLYMRKVGELLRSHGLALLQAITIEDHRYQQALHSVDFIKRHIFPGSFIPSVHALLAAKTAASDLALIHLEDFGLSYARTLQAWRERFLKQHRQLRAQGFTERFIRAWEFYLAYCEGGFRERAIGVAQLLLARPGWRPASALSAADPREALA
jgi:cyclopropane-fatty-acyl-phospholipid synthase